MVQIVVQQFQQSQQADKAVTPFRASKIATPRTAWRRPAGGEAVGERA
jgi:hypothetical protein